MTVEITLTLDDAVEKAVIAEVKKYLKTPEGLEAIKEAIRFQFANSYIPEEVVNEAYDLNKKRIIEFFTAKINTDEFLESEIEGAKETMKERFRELISE